MDDLQIRALYTKDTIRVYASDEVIEICIFENFDIGVRGDMCDKNLEIFIDEGWIDKKIKEKCIQLRNLFVTIEKEQPQVVSK